MTARQDDLSRDEPRVDRAASCLREGATKYVWWVTTVDSSTSYSGQSVSLSYYGSRRAGSSSSRTTPRSADLVGARCRLERRPAVGTGR